MSDEMAQTENMEVYNRVRSVPKEALKPINGGRLKGMSDINPMWRIKMLTEVFGICGVGWKVEITDRRLEKGHGDEVVCFVDINLYVKAGGEWSAPIPGMGGSSFVTAERNGIHTSDECFKMAYTDAISVACKALGFAADVYYANDRTKYTQTGNETPDAKPIQEEQNPFKSKTANEIKTVWVTKGYKVNAIDAQCERLYQAKFADLSEQQLQDFLEKCKQMSAKEKTA